jgi:hypothetical protein
MLLMIVDFCEKAASLLSRKNQQMMLNRANGDRPPKN